MTEGTMHNKYSLVKGAARRARQLQNGAPATIQSKSMKACRVAQDEIEQGQVSYTLKGKVGGSAVAEPATPAADEGLES